MSGIRYLDEFYKDMKRNAAVGRKIVAIMKDGKGPKERLIAKLEQSLERLNKIPKRDGNHVLLAKEGKKINVDLGYEIRELEKDLAFLREGEESLLKRMGSDIRNFDKDVQRVVKFLGKTKINTFITDRDGTINNYCARYMSSVQSIYNALFLSRFAEEFTKRSIIITSAPLEGLLMMNVSPRRSFIFAGSKGREYQTRIGKIQGMKIEKEKEKSLDLVAKEVKKVLNKPDNSKFYYIGSGFQKKYGQITVARQDVNNSVPRKESENFLKLISEIVKENDKQGFMEIEDTGLDIEIILNHGASAFSKGDGVEFLSRRMRLNLEEGTNLVCGDTSSDIPMAEEVASRNKNTKTIFVTDDEKLKRKVSKKLDNVCFVRSPDVLVTALNMVADKN